jgi:hypothetical protein
MSYFWTPKPIGLKADIERHRKEEAELQANIKELEENPARNDFEETALRVYRNFLNLLWESKAKTLEKLGRKM